MAKARLYIGTSGWSYSHWADVFYPADLRTDHWFEFYAERFRTVEINNSFYRLPSEAALEAWRERSPANFTFAVKASRYITHVKRLKELASVGLFVERVSILGPKLGPILFQLPPRWHANPERLDAFLASLPAGCRYAIELRDDTWFDARIYRSLQKHNVAFCIYEFDWRLSPLEVTADFVYVRLHGPGGKYQGIYGAEGLEPWAERVRAWQGNERDVYFYFDNDQAGYAAADAATLRCLVGDK